MTLTRLFRGIAIWALITLAWCAFVIALSSRLMAQTPCPPGTQPVDRYGFLCLPGTGELFVDVAGNQPALPLREPVPSVANASGTSLVGPSRATVFTAMRHAAATPSIILAHQKLASDAWIDRSKNKKGERCCDSGKDCWSLAPERVKPTEGGVNVTLDDGAIMFVPGSEIMPSEDGKYWLCVWGSQRKCFFAPWNGS